jgi:hypothetical protein
MIETNMKTEQLLVAFENDEKVYKAQIALGDALNRLKSNRDFNKLILTGFLEDEAVRLVHAKADPQLQTPEKQAAVIRDIDAIGTLKAYFKLVDHYAEIARKNLSQLDDAREYAIASQDEDQ